MPADAPLLHVLLARAGPERAKPKCLLPTLLQAMAVID